MEHPFHKAFCRLPVWCQWCLQLVFSDVSVTAQIVRNYPSCAEQGLILLLAFFYFLLTQENGFLCSIHGLWGQNTLVVLEVLTQLNTLSTYPLKSRTTVLQAHPSAACHPYFRAKPQNISVCHYCHTSVSLPLSQMTCPVLIYPLVSSLTIARHTSSYYL